MFGANPLRSKQLSDGASLLLQGVPFLTIQGEGPNAGLPAMFIRLWGCHLHCRFCDTDFESDMRACGIEELADACGLMLDPPKLVVLTGGEPMRQNIVPLCDLLSERGHNVQIETAGSFWFQQVPLGPYPQIVVSPKTSRVHPNIRMSANAWKYIISASQECTEDGLPVTNTQFDDGEPRLLARPPPSVPARDIYVQPMDEQDELKNAENQRLCVMLAKQFGYRVSLQQHKILGVP